MHIRHTAIQVMYGHHFLMALALQYLIQFLNFVHKIIIDYSYHSTDSGILVGAVVAVTASKPIPPLPFKVRVG